MAKKFDYKKYIVYISFVIVLVVFSVLLKDKGFLSYGNMMNILRQTAMISVAAVGMTFAISAGLIDLSKVRIPAFLVTLGTSSVYAGIARTITNLEAVPVTNASFNFIFGAGDIGPISTLFIWTIVIMILGHILYRKTPFGRAVLAVGGNEVAARYSGIKVERIKLWAMTICGMAAAFAGILYAGRLNGARYTLGENDNMSVIAAVVIGGTSFSGGKGTIVGTIIGSIVIGMLNNGLLLMGLSVSEQMMARGLIIILAVSLSLREKVEN